MFSPVFKDGQMLAGNTLTSEAPITAVQKAAIRKSSFQLPIKYNEVVILKLRNEIMDNMNEIPNAKILIKNAEAKLISDLDRAYNILQFYGVEYDEIKSLVGKYIQ